MSMLSIEGLAPGTGMPWALCLFSGGALSPVLDLDPWLRSGVRCGRGLVESVIGVGNVGAFDSAMTGAIMATVRNWSLVAGGQMQGGVEC